MINKQKIAVTLITGFLGAGKTTFINRLLKDNPSTRFALVENEFGEVAIDTKLIKGVDASQMFELKQGCICCTITDEFELVLQELAERFPNVEHLLIESTGVADPAPVIRPFFTDKNLKKIYQFQGTVCLVDALNFATQPEKEISLKQIATADFILINKTEKLADEKINSLKNELYKINSLAEIKPSKFGSVADFNLGRLEYQKKFFPDVNNSESIHSGIKTKTLKFNHPINRQKFMDWLSYNLDIYKKEIYRIKGILCFENEPFEYILQGVGGSFEILEGDLIVGEIKSEVVLIGVFKDLELEF